VAPQSEVLVFPGAKGSSRQLQYFRLAHMASAAPKALLDSGTNTKVALGAAAPRAPATSDFDRAFSPSSKRGLGPCRCG
jgi:hypothetical protein